MAMETQYDERFLRDTLERETHLSAYGNAGHMVFVRCVLTLLPLLFLYMLRVPSHTPRPLDANLGAKAE